MVHKLLLALSLLFSVAVLPAQPTPPTPPPAPAPAPAPPYLDEPDHWQIHDERGETPMRIDAELVASNDVCDVYYLTISGTTRDGVPVSNWAMAYDWNNGQEIQVYNNDSGLWTVWEWRGDHYEKVGGTANQRTYHPVY